jgi:protein-S-isoprenylcysteine O-methyltransferase Ste14
MKIIKDGNFTTMIRILIVDTGLVMAADSYYFMAEISDLNTLYIWIIMWFGLLLAAIGGYSSQANTLQIKPFGNLTFPKATLTKNITKSLEEVLDKMLFSVLLSFFFITVFYSPSLKPYLEIYIACVTVFVGLVALVVIFITIKELIRMYKENKKQNTHHDEIN